MTLNRFRYKIWLNTYVVVIANRYGPNLVDFIADRNGLYDQKFNLFGQT